MYIYIYRERERGEGERRRASQPTTSSFSLPALSLLTPSTPLERRGERKERREKSQPTNHPSLFPPCALPSLSLQGELWREWGEPGWLVGSPLFSSPPLQRSEGREKAELHHK